MDTDFLMGRFHGIKIALVVPCYNEAATIGTVIRSFAEAMPELDIFVFDNASTDRSAELASRAGATVVNVSLKGKGNVVRRMFADVEADVYVMVDADATYDASAIHRLVDKLIDERLDMVVGCRQIEGAAGEAIMAYRPGHQWGNRLLTSTVARIFGGQFTDMLSGYRVFTRRFAKSFPALSHGFETETELTVHALELRMPYGEVMTKYSARPGGSESKLSTYKDGWKILRTIGLLYISERPMSFFGLCSAALSMVSIIIFIPVMNEYLATGLVPRMPTAMLSAALMVVALLSFFSGMVLDNVTRGRHEIKRLVYLGIPALRRPLGK